MLKLNVYKNKEDNSIMKSINLILIISFCLVFTSSITAWGFPQDTDQTISVYTGINLTNLSQLDDTQVPTPCHFCVVTFNVISSCIDR
ncbi:unnamed protein product [marine sediment metagenome]|uniref:Uncharacterized protein n=1 Tax=marine sediment metagenome TaxID=412755 RepID=X1C4H2_9ZZZZ